MGKSKRISLQLLVWMFSLLGFSYTTQLIPVKYTISRSPLSLYGSSENGNCSSTSVNNDGSQVCTTPQSSVLLDGIIPPLTDIFNNTCWASQLLVLDTRSTITFEFPDPSLGVFNTQGFEIVMFNCPSDEIGAESVHLLFGTSESHQIRDIPVACNHLVRGCLAFQSITSRTITLTYVQAPRQITRYVFIAEISFYQARIDCSSAGIINPTISSTIPTCTPTTPKIDITTNKDISTLSTQDILENGNSEYVSNFTTGPSTIPRFYSLSTSDMSQNDTCLQEKSSISALSIALIALSVIIAVLIIALTILVIIICTYRNKLSSTAISNKAVYESPDNVKEESFQMTQSVIYGIHSVKK